MDKRILVPNTDLEMFPIGLGTADAGLRWDGEAADRIFDAYLDMCGPDADVHKSRMTRADMIEDLNGSLQKLRTDYIDVYFYHRDNPAQSLEETIETMQDFVREGKIRYYACSNWSAERMKAADAYCKEKGYRGFIADQSLLNLGMKYMNPLADDTLAYTKGEAYQYHIDRAENLMMPYMGNCSGFFHIYDVILLKI